MQTRDKKSLSPELWKEVEQIFITALDLPTEDRVSYLEKVCGSRSTLREEIDSLLAAHVETVGILDDFDAERAAELLQTEIRATSSKFGSYKIVREIGRGGMGTVYEAERADGQFEQRVALKVIKLGLDSEQLIQRFIHERQILAKLQHPNIARLLDGGISSDGRPFFVMEYIKGQSILTYSDENKLSINERLTLFVKVCDAVRYAHRNLVIHRDLKPGNILVTKEGDVKLLDFGIAKLLETSDDMSDGPVTETGVKAMTPEYASPEQVMGGLITTSTDVYALGVILYELLVGSRPYHFDRKSMHDVVRAICDTEPVKPALALSSEASGDDETISRIARSRQVPQGRLRKMLTGDLEAIMMMALQKNPDDRYISVEALQEDIRRYWKGLPVQSRATSFGYVARKYLRRHRIPLASVATLILLLFSFSTVLAVQASRLADERDKSRSEAEKAKDVASYLEYLFEASAPKSDTEENITAKELLKSGVVNLKEQFEDKPEVQALLLQVLGRAHYNLKYEGEAISLLQESIRSAIEQEGSNSLLAANSKFILAKIITINEEAGWEEEGEQLLREVLAVQRLHEAASTDITSTLYSLGNLLHKKGDKKGANDAAKEAFELMQSGFQYSTPEEIDQMFDIASLLRYAGDRETAEQLYLFLIEKITSDELAFALRLANAHAYLGSLYAYQGLNEQAFIQHEAAYEIRNNLEGFSLNELMGARQAYAIALSTVGRDDEAIEILTDVFDYWASAEDMHGYAYEEASFLLGKLYAKKNDFDRARFRFEKTIDFYSAKLGPDHFRVAVIYVELSKLYLSQSAYIEALSNIDTAIQAYSKSFSPTYALVINAKSIKANILLQSGRTDEAVTLLNELVSGAVQFPMGSHVRSIGPILLLSEAFVAKQQYASADSLLRKIEANLRTNEKDNAVFLNQIEKALSELHERHPSLLR